MATWKTVTVNPSGGDYATLNAALAGEATTLATQNLGDLVISCQNFADTTAVSTTGQTWNTDANNRVVIVAANDHGGKWSTSCYRNTRTTSGINFYQGAAGLEHLVLRGLQFYTDVDAGGLFRLPVGPTTGVYEIEKCIFVQNGTNSTSDGLLWFEDASPVFKIWNTIIYSNGDTNSAGFAIKFATSGAVGYVYNVTIDSTPNGIYGATAGGIRVKNTRLTNITDATPVIGSSWNAASDYNLTDGDASGVSNFGANSIDSGDTPTIAYVDDDNATLTSRDYHIEATDSGVGAGTNLSGDSNLAFSDDIDGDTRG